ncbi:PTS sugar transporter subunit IIA [Pectinatus haikarae]|uniref:PTS system mannose-specific IIA component/PTS system mannose-specific IIB component n=1 Tax=Pectinatus haikarae TaxID=349096 RepID=A0ABT9Y4H0_9FIRM|nr:PTS sugar transporter subunit IIA [Pectinatus haikarae]MDQ0202728.1 PTS system mannose-specific IIA component/PTS system mannose-specific IIB component [Pectinatus haikarae]
MLGIIVGTHGHLAEELVKTCTMICGQPDNLRTVTLVPGEGPDDLISKYRQAIKELGMENGIIILNDLFGGSPYNAACRIAADDERCGIVTGVNLPMLVEIINYRFGVDEKFSIIDILEKAKEAAGAGVQKFHKSMVTVDVEEEGDDL